MARLGTESSTWITVDSWESQQAEWLETVKVIRHHQTKLLSVEWNRDAAEPETLERRKSEENEDTSDAPQLMLLCGADLLESFAVPGLWKHEDVLEIVGHHGLVCITRSGYDPERFIQQSDVLREHRYNIYVVMEWVTNDISSTHVRRALCRGHSVCYLLPDPVLHYIQYQHLYSTESEQKNADAVLAPLQR